MPRSPAPPWRRRLEPILDHLLMESVNQAGGIYHPETGHYAELHYTGIETRERAQEIKKALYRAGKHTGHSVQAKIVRDGTGYMVRFKAIDKSMAKKYMVDHYGADRTKWPYSPFRRDPNYNSEGEGNND